MTFPAVPRDAAVELYVTGDWVDVTGDVRVADGIQIARGRPNEGSDPQPSTCQLTLDNRLGNYSPRNPLGDYFGSIGRNTPIRVGINTIKDTFTRISTNDWGVTDTGHDWSHGWSASSSINDFDVTGGVGTHTVTAASRWLITWINGQSHRDIDVTYTVTLPYADVLGNNITSGIVLRGFSGDDYYYADVAITTADEVWLRIWLVVNGVFTLLTDPVFIDNITYTGQPLKLRAAVTGHTILSKVWPASAAEPYMWHQNAIDDVITTAGFVGIRSDVYGGNTNPAPGVFSYDNFVARSMRFVGEVAAWPQRWDTSGADITAPIEAASVYQRLSQGSAPQLSTLYRAITGLTTPAIAYWPGEEGTDASTISSAIGGPPMVLTGDTTFAAYSEFVASRPIPTFDTGTWNGAVPTYTHTGALQLRFLLHTPPPADHIWMVGLQTTGGYSWDLKVWTTGGLSFDLWRNGVLIFTTGAVAFAISNKNLMVSIELEQNGSAVDWAFKTLDVDTGAGLTFSGSQGSVTLGRVVRVLFDPGALMAGMSIGHVHLRTEVTNLFDLNTELLAFAGEPTLSRISRLAGQNNVDVELAISDVPSTLVGPQRPLPLLTLLREVADADRGTFTDSRYLNALLFRELGVVYGQADTVTLDYAAGQVAPPFFPVDDDQTTRNSVTVNRVNGGFATAALEMGRLSVLPPGSGGVGAYEHSVDVNVYADTQLSDVAGWELNKGTVDETRYPVVRVALHSPAVVADLALSMAMLDLDTDDIFSIVNPASEHTPDTIEQIVLGYTEHIGAFEHSIAINAAPASPYRVLILDDNDSRLPTDGSDLTSSITTTAASFQVNSSGALWSTNPTEWPILLTVAGETISVGAVAGTGSPQTFSSVTRSVNGIVKAHSAGTPVSLTHRRVLGL